VAEWLANAEDSLAKERRSLESGRLSNRPVTIWVSTDLASVSIDQLVTGSVPGLRVIESSDLGVQGKKRCTGRSSAGASGADFSIPVYGVEEGVEGRDALDARRPPSGS